MWSNWGGNENAERCGEEVISSGASTFRGRRRRDAIRRHSGTHPVYPVEPVACRRVGKAWAVVKHLGPSARQLCGGNGDQREVVEERGVAQHDFTRNKMSRIAHQGRNGDLQKWIKSGSPWLQEYSNHSRSPCRDFIPTRQLRWDVDGGKQWRMYSVLAGYMEIALRHCICCVTMVAWTTLVQSSRWAAGCSRGTQDLAVSIPFILVSPC